MTCVSVAACTSLSLFFLTAMHSLLPCALTLELSLHRFVLLCIAMYCRVLPLYCPVLPLYCPR
jgi:hypothetical protein